MKQAKLLIYSILLLFLSSSLFSIGFINYDGDYVFHTNNPRPMINVSIQSPSEPLSVDKALLIFNDEKSEIEIEDSEKMVVPKDGIKTYSFNYEIFNISNNISNNDEVYFKLFAYGLDKKEIKSSGDNTDFFIILDTIKPKLITPIVNSSISLSLSNPLLNLEFSKKISKYEIIVGDKILIEDFSFNSFENQFENKFSIGLDENYLIDGTNQVEIKFWDLAGNMESSVFKINYASKPYFIELLTNEDSSEIPYYINPDFNEYFQNTIYSKDEIFTLKIKTNKDSICYFTEDLSGFVLFDDIPSESIIEFSSIDGMNHEMSINTRTIDKILVMCQNKYFENDKIYLNNILGFENSLINIKHFTNKALEITSILPEIIATSKPFDLELKTNELSVCSYDYGDGLNYFDLSGSTYNIQNLSISDGNYIFKFDCFDYLGNHVKEIINLEVDSKNGVQIVSYSPKYVSSSAINLNIVFSENTECRYSSTKQKRSNFNNLTLISGSSVSRQIQLSNLALGINKYYVYCQKGNIISEKNFEVFYDKDGPKIYNFTYVNDGIESNFVGSYDKISFKFDIASIIPIDKYYIMIFNKNETIIKEFQSTSASISSDFRNVSRIRIIPQNEVPRNGTAIEKSLVFDLDSPKISFSNKDDGQKIICSDAGGSGCYVIYYGLSKTAIDCNPTIKYLDTSETIETGDNLYICAYGKDKTGNMNIPNEIKELSLASSIKQFETDSNLNVTEDSSNDNLNESETSETTMDDEDPFSNINNSMSEDDSSFSYILVAAIFLVLVSVGSGGFYAYKKGYLNNELEKLGILKPQLKKTSHEIGMPFGNTKKNISQKVIQKLTKTQPVSKSNYEHHLDKLNTFVDTQLSKGDAVFGNFNDEDNKTEVLKSKKVSSISKEDIDEVYETSKQIKSRKFQKTKSPITKKLQKSSISKDDLNKHNDKKETLEKEAENFEEYYKKKNTNKKK